MGILLDVARGDEARFYPALSTLFSTGIRRGELLGLKWEDVDFKGSRISISDAALFPTRFMSSPIRAAGLRAINHPEWAHDRSAGLEPRPS